MRLFSKAGRLAAALALVVAALASQSPAAAAAKSVYIPSRWTQTGEVPWAQNRTAAWSAATPW